MEQYPEMTIEDIKHRWPDEWVLVEITRRDDHQMMAGWVIGHGSDQDVDRLVGQELALHQEHPGAETYLFWTGELIPEDMPGVSMGKRSAFPTDIPSGSQAVTDELLRNVTRRIVDALAPEQVILFGSYAEGRATADSDLDLLVVTERPVSRKERWLHTQGLFRDMPLPIQVITISRQEFEETRDVIGGIAYPAARYGRIIYAKS